MQNLLKLKSVPLRLRSRKSSLWLPASLFLLSVLPGCAQTALKPVSVKLVPKYLLSKLKSPDCTPQETAGTVRPEALGKSNLCWESAYTQAETRLSGLQSAVRARQKALAKAKAVAK